MGIKEKFKNYFKTKSKANIISDILLVLLIIAFIIPQTRVQLGALVNKAKILIVSPSVNSEKDMIKLKNEDYEMAFQNLDGVSVDISKLKGKVIFLNFWATWCPPCIAEMPNIQKLYDKYKDNSDVAFFMVSNQKQKTVKDFIEDKGYTFPVYINSFSLPKVFEYSSIPTTFVISKDGKIVIRETGAEDWSSKAMYDIMDKLLKDND